MKTMYHLILLQLMMISRSALPYFTPPSPGYKNFVHSCLQKCYNLSSVEAPQDSPPSETLIVRNLSREINPEVVKSYFEEHGSVKQFDELIGRRGMAFVTYNEISSAETAYRKLQGTVMNDSIISIEFEQTEPSNTKSRPTESNTNKNSPSETQITSGSLQEAKGDHPALDLSQAQPSTSKSADIPLVDSKLIQPESLPAEHEPKVEAKPIDGSDRLGEARKLQQMLSKIKDVNVPKTAPPSDPPASVPKPALSEQPTLRVESSWSSMDETVVGSQNSSDGDIDSPGLPSSADIASLMSWVQQQNASPQSQPAQTAPEPVPISWGSEKDNSIAMAHPSLDAPSANAVGQNMDVSMEGSFSTTPMPVPPVPVYPFVGYNSSMPWTNFTHSFGGGYGPMQLLPFSPSFLPLPLPPQPPIVPFTDQGTSSAVPTTAPVNLEAVEKLQKILSQILDHR
ncbi:hypothetical protein GYMLUDRAFT_773346 [Collybiopsis luxurians FD-317 M1]|uniref:RRM domain-containing protein n=1 Tax=Collybiopsis luxurians FD-317 M1 TaxID=944289 RepID=A0A0D0CG37_9AGAR|nr:hypothetical protein GYMLUDRAFT_773346 [Collybiopsis luxurians FD-317 M1]